MEDLRTFIREEKNLAEDFLEGLCPGEIIVLCGNGYALNWYCRFFAGKNVKPDYIVDKNCRQTGERFGIPVISYEYAAENIDLDKCRFVVTAPRYREEIASEIRQKFGDVRICSFEAEIYCSFLKDIQGYREFLLGHYGEIQDMYELFEDPKSKKTLVNFIKGRVSGNQKYFSEIRDPDPYFPEGIISLNSDEVIVEAGSYDGQTLLDIINRTGGCFQKIYCFEPDRECTRLLEDIIEKSGRPICLIKKGAGSRAERLYFKADSAYGTSRVVSGEKYDYSIEVTSIDEEVDHRVTYIKMDIEGMELSCLRGGVKTILADRPRLAVCVYHNKEDILEIPKYLKEINPQYQLYLRHHNFGAADTVLYAVL